MWDACTNPERLPRWFAKVTGELRVGGRYQVEGNAGGTIERCDPPGGGVVGFAATWEFGGEVSELASEPSDTAASRSDDRAQRGRALSGIEVRLAPAPDAGTVLTLEHVGLDDDAHWTEFGPGAVGIGWEMALSCLRA